MASFEIVLSPARTTSRPLPDDAPRRLRAAVDVLVSGVNVTARVEADQVACVLRDLALVLVDLASGLRRRGIVRPGSAAPV